MASNTVSLTMKPQNGSIELSRTALLIIDMQVSGARQHDQQGAETSKFRLKYSHALMH
jgi:hypothetical protein